MHLTTSHSTSPKQCLHLTLTCTAREVPRKGLIYAWLSFHEILATFVVFISHHLRRPDPQPPELRWMPGPVWRGSSLLSWRSRSIRRRQRRLARPNGAENAWPWTLLSLSQLTLHGFGGRSRKKSLLPVAGTQSFPPRRVRRGAEESACSTSILAPEIFAKPFFSRVIEWFGSLKASKSGLLYPFFNRELSFRRPRDFRSCTWEKSGHLKCSTGLQQTQLEPNCQAHQHDGEKEAAHEFGPSKGQNGDGGVAREEGEGAHEA